MEKDIENLTASVAKLLESATVANTNIAALGERLKKVEEKKVPTKPEPTQGSDGQVSLDDDLPDEQAGPIQGHPGPGNLPLVTTAGGFQAEYEAVRDGLKGVQLPTGWKIKLGKRGVKKEDIPQYEVIEKCTNYTETVLKILGTAQQLQQSDISDIINVLRAELQHLEDKYSLLIVRAKHSKEVATYYEMYNEGTSGLSDRHRKNLKMALDTAPPLPPPPPPSRNDHRGGYSGGRGRGRYFHGNEGRGQRNDTYAQLSNKQLPSTRPNQDNQ